MASETPERALLTDLRQVLLRLHKTMLDWERTTYDRVHGRTTGHALLQAILNDPQFAWLRPLSELIVRIDETLDNDVADVPGEADAIVAQVRKLVSPTEQGAPYADRYQTALQENPDAVFAHRDVGLVLKKHRDPSSASGRAS
jgi:hypothetical protein